MRNSQAPERQAAALTLLVLRASLDSDRSIPIHRWRWPPAKEVSDTAEAINRLIALRKPVRCEAHLQQDVIDVSCRDQPNTAGYRFVVETSKKLADSVDAESGGTGSGLILARGAGQDLLISTTVYRQWASEYLVEPRIEAIFLDRSANGTTASIVYSSARGRRGLIIANPDSSQQR
jgi:hypothetical protein